MALDRIDMDAAAAGVTLNEQITFKLAEIGRYFLHNYDFTLHDGQMRELAGELYQLESLKERQS
jgi:hypothetical protein